MYVDCELFWPDRSAKPRNLSERLTGSLGLDWKHYRVHIGDLVFSFSRYQTEERFRLDEIDAYTNPQAWKREALPAPPADAMSGYLLFNVPYDEQEVVYAMGDRSELVFDAEHARLCIRFPEVARDGQWIELADTLFAVVDGSELVALQFEAFAIVGGHA